MEENYGGSVMLSPIVVLMCVSSETKHVVQSFLFSQVICISSFIQCLLKYFMGLFIDF